MKKVIVLISIIGLLFFLPLMAEAYGNSTEAPLSVDFSYDKDAYDVNAEISLYYSISGGTPPYSGIGYVCFSYDNNTSIRVNEGSLSEANGVIRFTPTVGQSTDVYFYCTDSVGRNLFTYSESRKLLGSPVVAPLSVEFSFDKDTYIIGEEISLTYIVSGGTPSYSGMGYVCFSYDNNTSIRVNEGNLSEASGVIKYTPTVGQSTDVYFYCTDSVGRNFYGFSESRQLSDSPDTSELLVDFSFDKSTYDLGTEISLSYTVSGGTPPYTGMGYVCFSYDNNTSIRVNEGGLSEATGVIKYTPTVGQSTDVYFYCTDSVGRNFHGFSGRKLLSHVHSLTFYPEIQATCAETGTEAYWYCDVCGLFFSDKDAITEIEKPVLIAAKGHTEMIDAAVPATETTSGLSEGIHCSVCGKTIVAQEIIPILAHVHIEVVDAEKAATCTETGLTEGKHCSVCNTVIVAQEIIPALGHDWDDGIVTKEATSIEKGIRTFSCKRCGTQKEEEIIITIPVGKTGWIHNSNGTWSYGDSDGNAVVGSKTIEGTMYHFNNQGIMITGWSKENGKWYYAQNTGALYHSCWQKIKSKWYYFLADGEMATGWINDGKAWYFMKPNGAMATGWIKYQDEWYYLKADGSRCTGWLKENNTWYYLQPSGEMAIGLINIDGTKYYMKSSGAMATGWVQDQGVWYYFMTNGAMATGWLKDGGKWYMLKPDGIMATGWYKDGGAWYYLSSSGAMVTGWKLLDGKWYYFKDSGEMATGWFQDNSKNWYWFDKDGIMVTGRYEIDGKWEVFDSSGAWKYTESE